LFYAVANGFYVVGLGFAPLSLMSALFATVLVFNAIFANRFLGEVVHATDVYGLCIILGCIGLCGSFGPTANKDVSADDIWRLVLDSTGILFWTASISTLLVLILKVQHFEANYPAFGNPDSENMVEDGSGALTKTGERKPYIVREPDKSEVLVMMVVYPFILAIFESLGQVGMKAVSCMLKLQGEGVDQMGTTTFWVCCFLLCVDGYLIILWLAKVYGKFDTTDCLPIEYGIVTVVSVGSGIVFFQEYKEVETTDLCVMGGSLVGCCYGIYVATISKRQPTDDEEHDPPKFDPVSAGGRSSVVPGDMRRNTARKSVADKYLRKTGDPSAGNRRRQTVRSMSLFPPPLDDVPEEPVEPTPSRRRGGSGDVSNASPESSVRRMQLQHGGAEQHASNSTPVPNNQLQDILTKPSFVQPPNPLATNSSGNQENSKSSSPSSALVVSASQLGPSHDAALTMLSDKGAPANPTHALKEKELELREQELELRQRMLQHAEKERDFENSRSGAVDGAGFDSPNGNGTGAQLSSATKFRAAVST
jgi:hypothetical protein